MYFDPASADKSRPLKPQNHDRSVQGVRLMFESLYINTTRNISKSNQTNETNIILCHNNYLTHLNKPVGFVVIYKAWWW